MKPNPIATYCEDRKIKLFEMRPYCAICGNKKRVESISTKRRWGSHLAEPIIVTVYCHGQSQEMEIEPSVLNFQVSEPGMAFDTKLIEL